MSYAHSWRRPLELDTIGFSALVDDVKLLFEKVAHMDMKLAGPNGTGAPDITDYAVAFNGSLTCGHRFIDLGKPFPRDNAEGVHAKEPPYDRNAPTYASGPFLLTRACGGNCAGEPFILDRKYLVRDWEHPDHDGFFSSCETNFKPYDILVTATLIRMKERLGDDIKIDSDGGDNAFADAKRICRELFGYPNHFRLETLTTGII